MGIGIPIGGIKTLGDSFVRFIRSHGGTIITNSRVDEVVVGKGDGRAIGVRCADGKIFAAKKAIIVNAEPKSLFLKLLPQDSLQEEFKKKIRAFRFSKVSEVMIHAALSEWLDYKPFEVRSAGMVQIGEALDEVSRAFNDCITGRLPDIPFMTINNTTCYDKTRAPPGKHTMWNFARAPVLINGSKWNDNEKEKFADTCISRLSEYAPNTKAVILKRVVLSPQDIEAMNPNMVNGDPGVGKPGIDQSLALRPVPGWSNYRTPIKGLYLCGGSTHPGGGINGASGHNAAQVALADSGIGT